MFIFHLRMILYLKFSFYPEVKMVLKIVVSISSGMETNAQVSIEKKKELSKSWGFFWYTIPFFLVIINKIQLHNRILL